MSAPGSSVSAPAPVRADQPAAPEATPQQLLHGLALVLQRLLPEAPAEPSRPEAGA